MELSTYQQGIINWVLSGEGHGCCKTVLETFTSHGS